MAGFDPVRDLSKELEQMYGSAILFFSGGHERPVIAGLWNPQTAARPWTVNLAWSTKPVMVKGNEKMQAQINKEAIVAEIAKLAGEMVSRVEVNHI
jgi:U3 small nucleolar RNA-associated protein 22